MKLKQIKVNTNWASAAQAINDNSQTIQIEFEKFLYGATNRGYFFDLYDLEVVAYPTANWGDIAFVFQSMDGENYWQIYYWDGNGWAYSDNDVPIETEIDLSGDLNISSLNVDNGIHSNDTIKSDGQMESFGGFVITDKTNEDVVLAGGGTVKIDDLLTRFNKTVKHTSDEQEVTIEPNTFHVWDSVYMLYVTLGEAKEGDKSEYLFQFTAGVWLDECLIDAPFPLHFDTSLAWKYGHTYLVHIVNGNGTVYEYEPYVPEDEIWFYSDNQLIAPNLSNLSNKYGPIAYTYDASAGKHILKIEGAWISEIPDSTFADSNLWSVMLPSAGVRIGNYAFSDCENLQNIYTPFVRGVGIEAFRNSPMGLTIDLTYCENIGEGAFEGTSVHEIIIPQSITTIPVNCFYGCWNLHKVKLPEGLKVIGTSAFSDCSNLEDVTIPSTVEHLGEDAFLGCTSLKKIEVPSGVLELFARCFAGCTSLEEVIWHEGKSGVDARSIYSEVFSGCTNLRKVTIPEGVADIQNEAFAHTAISTFVLPSTVTDIGSYSFDQMPNLQTIYCKAPRPPYVDSGFMLPVSSTIYVPEGVVGNYQSANGWSEFANAIVEYNFAGPWNANLTNYYDKREIDNKFENFKTINGESILGEGNIEISGDSGHNSDIFRQNMMLNYGYDKDTGTSYTAVRVFKKKTDGTSQYPYVFAPNGDGAPICSGLDVAIVYGFPLTINAGCGGTFGSPNGTLIQNGVVIQQGPTQQHPTALPLTIDSNGDLWYASASSDAETMVSNGIISAVCGFMPIVKDYIAVPESEWITEVSHFTEQAQRQIIGQYANGDYAIITCEGRNFANSPGWTIAQAQSICIGLGLKFAYNLDGGGSTSVVIGKKQLNLIYEGETGRKVPAFIVFTGNTLKPGTDITDFPNASDEPTSELPDGYTLLDYIEVNGGQYVSSGIPETKDISVEYAFAPNANNGINSAGHILSSTNIYTPYLRYNNDGSKNMIAQRFGNQQKFNYVFTDNVKYTIKAYLNGTDYIYVNGSFVGSCAKSSAVLSESNKLYLFAYGGSLETTRFRASGKFYYMVIYDSAGRVLRHFVPCKNADSVVGLFDVANRVFYESETDVAFTSPK